MEEDRIIYKITVADIQKEIGGRMGRELTDEEILYLEKEMPDYVSWGRDTYHALLFKDFKFDESKISELIEKRKKKQ